MEALEKRISVLESELKKFWSRRSQSDPTSRADSKDMRDELEALKRIKATLADSQTLLKKVQGI